MLSEDEIGRVLASCREDDFGRIVRLVLLTGQRRDEVAELTWPEVDLTGALWSLSGDQVKNGLNHDVPLSASALQLLLSTERIEGRQFVFGQGRNGFQGFAKAKAALDKR